MYRSSLVTGLAVAFAAMGSVLAIVAAGTGNWLAIVPAAFFGATAYFMWFHASGRLADRIYRTMEGAATRQQDGRAGRGGRRQSAPGGRRAAPGGRRAATDGRGGDRTGRQGGFGAGPRADWERPGGESRERVRQAQARQERARRQRAREHAKRVGGGGRRVARGQAPTGMTAREAANVLGVGPDADDDAVRTAYRERIKEVHPDTEGGDEEAFKRVRDAYERLQE